jgi:cell division protein FtsZ
MFITDSKPILVIGVGGCGCSTLQALKKKHDFAESRFLAINTDLRSLRGNVADDTIQIGQSLTNNLGAGANPDVGRLAAIESEAEISKAIEQASIIFITAGMGGGTGTGAISEVARIAQTHNIPVIALVTKPFSFEGMKKARFAEEGITALQQYCNALVVLPNDRLSKVLGGKVRLIDAFKISNQLLLDTLSGLSFMLSVTGLINIDISDFKTVIHTQGCASVGMAKAKNASDIETAINRLLDNPLVENIDISSANGAIINIVSQHELALDTYHLIGNIIQQRISAEANLIVGLTIDPSIKNAIEVFLLTTGIAFNPKPILQVCS